MGSRSGGSAWLPHSLDPEECLHRLSTASEGLDSADAEQRLADRGPNRLPEGDKPGPIRRFLSQFHNVLIYILIAAAAGTALLQHWIDTGVILGVVLINAVVGFVQEGKAERALDAIRGMLSPKAVVRRDGRRRTVPAEELVPGDIVVLQAGDRVPADLRLLHAHNLRIDEAMLTGESVAADKQVDAVAEDVDLGDRASMAFSGTLVNFGQGEGVVTATGRDTEIGRISTLLGAVETLTTPLLQDIKRLGQWLSVGIIVIAASTFAFGYWVRGLGALDTFLAAVSLAVAAIPEGLPAIMTITLAIGVQRMAARNAIIRRLPAVETLGSMTTICSDKTGTLTRNEMTVKTILTAEDEIEVSGAGYEPCGGFQSNGCSVDPEDDPILYEALQAMLLCNDAEVYSDGGAWALVGDPTEGALVVAALKAGLEQNQVNASCPRVDVIPFESGHKYMATLHNVQRDGKALCYLKGAPERVFGLCDRERTAAGDRPLANERWERCLDAIAARGQRVLALATRSAPAGKASLSLNDVADGQFTLIAVCGIVDPPRAEAIEAIRRCQDAGIRVKMITGDHAVTAGAIAQELGIRDADGVVTGRDLEGCSDDELGQVVRDADVFARTTPEHKLRLVKALQSNADVVGMTGDGVNDAPALKRADIGVAMGVKGTEASRQAAEMVLTDDNFASIVHAVEEGRTVYDNLRKAILFLLPTNGGQALTIVAAILLGVTLPLTPVQVLWVNMVTAVTLALALAFEPAEPGLMQRPPRPPNTPIMSGFLLWRIGFVSLLLVAGTFGHFVWLEAQGASEAIARSAAINTLVVGQVFYLFNSRYILEPVCNRVGLLGSRAIWLAIIVMVVLQALFTYAPPLQFLFGTTAIDALDWLRILAFGVVVFALVEIEKRVVDRRHARAR